MSSWGFAQGQDTIPTAIDEAKSATASNQSIALEATGSSETNQRETGPHPVTPLTNGSTVESESRITRRSPSAGRALLRSRTQDATGTVSSDRSTPWYRTTPGSLALVLGLMGVMYVVVKRWAPAAKAAESGILRVVARANLTPKHGVALVQVGRRFLVLGVAPSGIGALAEIRDPDEVADLTVRSGSSATSSSRDFNDVLGQSLSGFNPAAAVKSMQATTASSPLTDGVGDLLRRLRNVTARSAENARRGGSVAAANR